MADLFENPMGLAGFEFVEFTAPEKGNQYKCYEDGSNCNSATSF